MALGALIGLVSGALAIARFRFTSLGPRWARLASILAISGSIFATLTMLPAWIVAITGKDTRGEAFDRTDLPILVYLVMLAPVVTLGAYVWRCTRARRSAAALPP